MKTKIGFCGLILALICGAWSPVFGQIECFSQYPGCLDSSFGTLGKVILPAGMSFGNMAIQLVNGEERIVVGGGMPGTRKVPGYGVVIRYLPDGTLDTTFGAGGIAKFSPGNKLAGIQGVAIQPDQKIVVAGVAAPLSKPNNMNTLPTIGRFNVDGSLDTTFGTSGWTQIRCLADNRIGGDSFAVTVQADGKIAALTFFAAHLGVCRLNPNGMLDTTFNGSGRYFETRRSCAFDIATQWIDGEERILISGNIDGSSSSYSKALLMRFTAAGSHDQSFGESGYVTGDYRPYRDGYAQMAVDSSNRIIVCWDADDFDNWEQPSGLVRHSPDGSLDASFGTNGMLIPLPGGAAWDVRTEPGTPLKILAGGLAESFMAVWRLTEAGVLDATFSTSGMSTTGTGGAGAKSLVLQSDGKFVALADGYLVRYWR